MGAGIYKRVTWLQSSQETFRRKFFRSARKRRQITPFSQTKAHKMPGIIAYQNCSLTKQPGTHIMPRLMIPLIPLAGSQQIGDLLYIREKPK
jgi:hypothetical protein